MSILIRKETAEDYSTTENIVEKSFKHAEYSDQKEHFLVNRLRFSDAFIPELSLVAVNKDSEIVGHTMLTRIQIENDASTTESLALAPVSVLPEYQYIGIGSTLIRTAIEKARELGYGSIIVLGHKDYYPKFGFQRAAQWNIKAPFEVSDDVFMALELVEGALETAHGTVRYSQAFFE
jgi:predicted N-acetyltransferase YhbS